MTDSKAREKAAPRGLLPEHERLIKASAISDAVAEQRGYWSATKRSELRDLGFTESQRLVPALVIPIYGVTGDDPVTYQARPNVSRIKDGKPLKYETPSGSRMVIDVPLAIRPQLGDPSIPMYITEGCRKADAAVSAGLCCVALLGVWNWRGTNEKGGKTVLADFESIAWNERTVYLAFDSDATTKPEVTLALRRLKGLLESRKAKVLVVYLPPNGDSKVGLDDFLSTGHTVDELPDLAEEDVRAMPRAANTSTVQPPIQPPELAYSKRVLDEVSTALQPRIAGEVKLVKLVYLAATSRLLDGIPASVAIKGPSAAGKSSLLEKTLSLFPADAFYVLTAMSEHSLAYGDEPLEHRMLVIYEATMLGGGGSDRDSKSHFMDYLLRSLLSEGHIRYETVEKDQGGQLISRVIERAGPTGLLTTTTATSLHPENETRLLSLTVDDSKEQTKRVIRLQAAAANGEHQPIADLERWHALQDWLQAQAPQRVTIPYSKELAELIPPLAIRLRRDFPLILTLVQTHAILHQLNRERDDHGHIVASLDDYRVVRELVADLIADEVGAAVSTTVRVTVLTVQKLLARKAPDGEVTVAELAKALNVDKAAALRRSRVAVQNGYLVNREDRRGRPARLVLGGPLPEEETLLPTPEDVQGCTVDGDAEERSARARVSEDDATPDDAERCPNCDGGPVVQVGSFHNCNACGEIWAA